MVLNHTASLFCINILRANLDLPVPVNLSRVDGSGKQMVGHSIGIALFSVIKNNDIQFFCHSAQAGLELAVYLRLVLLPNKPGLKNIFTRGTDRLIQHSTQIQAPPQICSPKAKPLGFRAS